MSMQPEIRIDVLMNVSHIGDISYCFVIYESIIIIIVHFYIRVCVGLLPMVQMTRVWQ